MNRGGCGPSALIILPNNAEDWDFHLTLFQSPHSGLSWEINALASKSHLFLLNVGNDPSLGLPGGHRLAEVPGHLLSPKPAGYTLNLEPDPRQKPAAALTKQAS